MLATPGSPTSRRGHGWDEIKTVLWAVLVVACGTGPPAGPIAPLDIAGEYRATNLFVTAPDHTRDLLADGSTLSLTLSSGFALSGRLHVPESEGEPELDREIRGVWTYDPVTRTMRVQEQEATFLSEMEFRRAGTGEMTSFSATLLQPAERLNHSSPITQIDVTLVKGSPE